MTIFGNTLHYAKDINLSWSRFQVIFSGDITDECVNNSSSNYGNISCEKTSADQSEVAEALEHLIENILHKTNSESRDRDISKVNLIFENDEDCRHERVTRLTLNSSEKISEGSKRRRDERHIICDVIASNYGHSSNDNDDIDDGEGRNNSNELVCIESLKGKSGEWGEDLSKGGNSTTRSSPTFRPQHQQLKRSTSHTRQRIRTFSSLALVDRIRLETEEVIRCFFCYSSFFQNLRYLEQL